MKKIIILWVSFILILTSSFITVKAEAVEERFLAEVKLGENVHIKQGEIEDSDVVTVGGKIHVDGIVNGGIMSLGEDIHINGDVRGNVVSIGGRVILNNNAKVLGEVSQIGKDVRKLIESSQNSVENIKKYNNPKIHLVIFSALIFILIAIFNCIPANIDKMATNLNKTIIKDFIYGYLIIAVSIVTVISLILTILGIIILPFMFIAMGIVFMIGLTSVCTNIGKSICRKLKKKFHPIIYIFIGWITCYITVVFISSSTMKVLLLFFMLPICIGVCINSKFGTFKPWMKQEVKKWDWYRQE